ncbi:hypothetical protein [Sphingomonas sp. PP-CE-1G-424]|uniref:hypothetical protein n=1 Tax=Sphingomonas sp. PP-CE-1G-424 TaxID=2135658 RepID=UPI00105591F6|nr:hypothetical protein [Sphingomonas sp. PP-CE-1G-424]
MWPFSRRKSPADLAIEWMPHAIDVASQKWLEFQLLPFRAEVPLETRIMAFVEPLKIGLRQWEAFRTAPDAIFLLIAAKGVEKSGTHSISQLEQALKVSLPA